MAGVFFLMKVCEEVCVKDVCEAGLCDCFNKNKHPHFQSENPLMLPAEEFWTEEANIN